MAEEIGIGVATKCVERLVDKAIKEAHYLCCFHRYVDDFEDRKTRLEAKRDTVNLDIQEAINQNENVINPDVQHWQNEANSLIQEDPKRKQKWFFGLCTNCIWQNRRAKDLEGKAQKIEILINNSSFPQVARSAGSPGLKFHHSQDFIQFESRKLKYEELKEALKNTEHCMIGLQGMGGAGKTTMAIQIGKEVEDSKVFDKVIFTVASNSNRPVDVATICGEIARHLGLPLSGENKSCHAEQLWTRISNNEGKLLIILDDVWDKELNLQAIGIPLGGHQKGHCTVLLTTRDLGVCTQMRCQKTIQLESLSPNDALDLFLFHSGKSSEDCIGDFKDVALQIIEECGRLPIAIVTIARSLNFKPLRDWEAALTRLQAFDPMLQDENEDLTKAYKSLGVSFDNLNDNKAEHILFVCSLFPEDYEIPLEQLRRISIGLGFGGEVMKYEVARSRVLKLESKLKDSSLLLKAKGECVKLHDLVRDVAIRRANTKIQMVMDSKTTLMESIQYASWNSGGFPNHFVSGVSDLEFLLVWNSAANDEEVPVVPFEGMSKLRVFISFSTINWNSMHSSLKQSFRSLINLRTLILSGWELGDISFMVNLKLLETLEIVGCSMDELPDAISGLEKFTLLGIKKCRIRSNPFKVIERCSHLEELYFDGNDIDGVASEEKDERQYCIGTLNLERYRLKAESYFSLTTKFFEDLDESISRCFIAHFDDKILSEEEIKSLAARAHVLELYSCHEKGWRNIIPDFVGEEDEGMKDLIRLHLSRWSEIECLISTQNFQPGVTIFFFSKLVELELFDMENVRELCCGPLPLDFLKQLEKLELHDCTKLAGTLLKGELDLGKLKSIILMRCSLTSLFDPSTIQSLKQLETLKIYSCNELEYIVMMGEGSGDKNFSYPNPNQRSLSKLKILDVDKCDKLEYILPICFAEDTLQLEDVSVSCCEKLKCIFGPYTDEKGSHQKEKNITLPSLKTVSITQVPKFVNIYPECYRPRSSIVQESREVLKVTTDHSPSHTFSWASICCFMPKSSDASIDNNPSISEATVTPHTTSQTPKTEWIFNVAQCLLKRPLNPLYMRKIEITVCSELTSLFTLSLASSMSLLEELKVVECHGLKSIVIDDGDGHDHTSYSSIFPYLRQVEVKSCDLLEFLFPASHVGTFEHLEDLIVSKAPELRYVFGKCYCEDNVSHQNQNSEINLPALKLLSLQYLPKMVSICFENCHLTASSLDRVILKECPKLSIERQDHTIRKAIDKWPRTLYELELSNIKIDIIYDLEGLQIDGFVASSLKKMRLINLPSLSYIFLGPLSTVNFEKLYHLKIEQCNKLRFILSASILQSLPVLMKLEVFNCEELVQIIEETHLNPHPLSEKCFPELKYIDVRGCKSLKCLFHISTFGCKQGDTKVLKDVFPKISTIQLIDLPSLNSIFHGIDDFEMVPCGVEIPCPDIYLISTATMVWQKKQRRQQTQEIEVASDQTIHSEQSNTSPARSFVPSESEFSSNIEVNVGKGPSSEKENQPTSSTHSNIEIAYSGPSTSTKELHENKSVSEEEAYGESTNINESPRRIDNPFNNAQIVTSLDDTSTLSRLMVNEIKTYTDKKEVGQINTQFEDDDLIRLFQIVEEGADIRGHMPYVSEISFLKDDDKVAKAFSEVQVLLKMNVSEVASSEENSLRLENALNFLSSHYSDDGGAPSHRLKAKIDTMHQEISSILSSFKQASARLASIDTFTKLEEKDKCINKELPMQKEAALTLVSEIHEIKKSMQELTEDISRLQAELNRKEKQIQECKIKLSEKEKSVWETIGFLDDYEAMKEDRSQIEEDTMMAKQELEKVNYKWSSCEAKWWKTLLLQRIYRKQNL